MKNEVEYNLNHSMNTVLAQTKLIPTLLLPFIYTLFLNRSILKISVEVVEVKRKTMHVKPKINLKNQNLITYKQ